MSISGLPRANHTWFQKSSFLCPFIQLVLWILRFHQRQQFCSQCSMFSSSRSVSSVKTLLQYLMVVIGPSSWETQLDGYWFRGSWICLALVVKKRASLSDPLVAPIPKSRVRGLLQQGRGAWRKTAWQTSLKIKDRLRRSAPSPPDSFTLPCPGFN